MWDPGCSGRPPSGQRLSWELQLQPDPCLLIIGDALLGLGCVWSGWCRLICIRDKKTLRWDGGRLTTLGRSFSTTCSLFDCFLPLKGYLEMQSYPARNCQSEAWRLLDSILSAEERCSSYDFVVVSIIQNAH